LIQHQKRVREKNKFKLWRDCRKIKNDDARSVKVNKDKGLVNKRDKP